MKKRHEGEENEPREDIEEREEEEEEEEDDRVAGGGGEGEEERGAETAYGNATELRSRNEGARPYTILFFSPLLLPSFSPTLCLSPSLSPPLFPPPVPLYPY